jgi:hypothetical protein
MQEDRTNQPREQGFSPSADSPTPKSEQMQELVNALAIACQEASRGATWSCMYPG